MRLDLQLHDDKYVGSHLRLRYEECFFAATASKRVETSGTPIAWRNEEYQSTLDCVAATQTWC